MIAYFTQPKYCGLVRANTEVAVELLLDFFEKLEQFCSCLQFYMPSCPALCPIERHQWSAFERERLVGRKNLRGKITHFEDFNSEIHHLQPGWD